MFDLVLKHLWLVFMVVTVLNAGILHWGSRNHIARDPALADGYRKLVRGIIVYGNFPWIVMAVGMVFGGVPSMENYFRPQDMNPYVLAFYGSIGLLWILGTWWIFARGGAEMIIRHPSLLRARMESPWLIKAYWAVFTLVGFVVVKGIISFKTGTG